MTQRADVGPDHPTPAGPELAFDGGDLVLDTWFPPAVERVIPGLDGSTFVHAYTGKDAGRWKRLAHNMMVEQPLLCKGADGKPSDVTLQVAQAVVVCRRGPLAVQPTFILTPEGFERAWQFFTEQLPGTWVQQVCHDSDWLTMQGYHRPARAEGTREGGKTLSNLLNDDAVWDALDLISAKLFGVPLCESGKPLAQVMNLLQADQEVRESLASAIGSLMAVASGPAG